VKGRAAFATGLKSVVAAIPGFNPKNYLHHLGSDNDLSLWGKDTLTAGSEFSLLLGLGSKDDPGDETKGNVFIMGGESVRILSNTDVELAAKSKLHQCSSWVRLTGRGKDENSSGSVLLEATDGSGDSTDKGKASSQVMLLERSMHASTCVGGEEESTLGALVLNQCSARLSVDNADKAVGQEKATVILAANKNGTAQAGLLLGDDQTASLVAGDWGVDVRGGEHQDLVVGTEKWGLFITKDTVEVGELGRGQVHISPGSTDILDDAKLNLGAGTDVTFEAPKVSFGGAEIDCANLTVKGESLGNLSGKLQKDLEAIRSDAKEDLQKAMAALKEDLAKKPKEKEG